MSQDQFENNAEETQLMCGSYQLAAAQEELRNSKIASQEREEYQAATNDFACDLVASEVSDGFTDVNSLSSYQKNLLRSSILSAAAVKAMDDTEAIKRNCLSERSINIAIFALVICLSCAESLIGDFTFLHVDKSIADPKKQNSRRCPYPVPFGALVAHILNTIACTSFVIYKEKGEGLKRVLNFKELFKYTVFIFGFAASELANKYADIKIDKSYVKALGQSKLLFAAVFGYFITKSRLNATQWAIVLAVTSALLSATFAKIKTNPFAKKNSADGKVVHNDDSVQSTQFVLISIMCLASYAIATICGLLTERAFKKNTESFMASFTKSRIGHVFWSVISIIAFQLLGYNEKHQKISNFGFRHIPFTVLTAVYAFLVTMIVKRLDSLWKAFVGASAVVFTPLILRFSPITYQTTAAAIMNNLTIGISVIAFAFSKRDHNKFLQLTSDINEIILVQSKV